MSTPEIDSKGTKRWYNTARQLDREDGPAREWADGYKAWYKDGLRHRLDGPAAEYANGTKVWYKDGLRHRLDGPAAEYANGTKVWYKDDLIHRLDGPAVEWAGQGTDDGTKEWWVNGKQTTEENLETAVKLYYCWLVLES